MTNKEAANILTYQCRNYSTEELHMAFNLAIKALEDLIDNAPTVEACSQGEWIKDKDTGLIGCSNCHIAWLRGETAYCPNCGAKMKLRS